MARIALQRMLIKYVSVAALPTSSVLPSDISNTGCLRCLNAILFSSMILSSLSLLLCSLSTNASLSFFSCQMFPSPSAFSGPSSLFHHLAQPALNAFPFQQVKSFHLSYFPSLLPTSKQIIFPFFLIPTSPCLSFVGDPRMQYCRWNLMRGMERENHLPEPTCHNSRDAA